MKKLRKLFCFTLIALACSPLATAMAQSNIPKLIPLFKDAEWEEYRGETTPGIFFTLGNRSSDANDQIPDDRFAVFGRATQADTIGIDEAQVTYRHIPESKRGLGDPREAKRLPDLESFFEFGGTIELLTEDENTTLEKFDLIISEILWGLDTGVRDQTGQPFDHDDDEDPDSPTYQPVVEQRTPRITIGQLNTQGTQWLELYNTTNQQINIAYHHQDLGKKLYLLFTPFVSYPDRTIVTLDTDGDGDIDANDKTYKVLDAISNLLFGRWRLPGKSGRRPTTAFVSAYRDIDYDVVEDYSLTRAAQLAGIPFGSHPESWEATPDSGRRNTILKILASGAFRGFTLTELPHVSTPGTRHVSEVYITPLKPTAVGSNSIVINEVRNDTSQANVDWIELKNIGRGTVDLEKWELSIVTDYDKDADLVDLPPYLIGRNEILLICNTHPRLTDLAAGINIQEYEEHQQPSGAQHKYLVAESLDLPDDKRFLLLLRSENDQNGTPNAVVDYTGNGFFADPHGLTTSIWPLLAQRIPRQQELADFGRYTFASSDQAWARIRYERNDNVHKEAWKIVATQGGIGYVPAADLRYAPGTPGYENNALKTQLVNEISPLLDEEYDDGEISISEIMYDPGPNGTSVQWIELYNASQTQAVDIKGWRLDIQNFEHGYGTYVDTSFEFLDAVIRPNQTLLIVSKRGSTNVPSNTLYNLFQNHKAELKLVRGNQLLNPVAFHIKLTDTADPEREGDDILVDEVGNLEIDRTRRSKLWDLPNIASERRRSFVRRYGRRFDPDTANRQGRPNPPNKGTTVEGWRLFPREGGQSFRYYGLRSDLASPGYRKGGPLPVILSSFRPVRTASGTVRITWRTASELNNAGFNILRHQHPRGAFQVLNRKGIIPGQGTSSETHAYTYIDTTAKQNTTYYYRIEDVSFAGIRQTLATTRLKGDISSVGKLTTMWSRLKGGRQSPR